MPPTAPRKAKPKPPPADRVEILVSLPGPVAGWLADLVCRDAARLGVRADRHRSPFLAGLIRDAWLDVRLKEEVEYTDRELAAGRR